MINLLKRVSRTALMGRQNHVANVVSARVDLRICGSGLVMTNVISVPDQR